MLTMFRERPIFDHVPTLNDRILKELVAIELETQVKPMTGRDLLREANRNVVVGAWMHGHLVGVIFFANRPGMVVVNRIGVLPKYRRHKIGRDLLSYVDPYMNRRKQRAVCAFEHREEHDAAAKFFSALGWTGELDHFADDDLFFLQFTKTYKQKEKA